MLVKNYCKGPFDPTYIYDHWVAEILLLLLTTPDGKEIKCNIHHVKLVSSLEVYVGLQAEIPKVHFLNSRTASYRHPVGATPTNSSILRTYDQKLKINKYKSIFMHNNMSGKKFNNCYSKITHLLVTQKRNLTPVSIAPITN